MHELLEELQFEKDETIIKDILDIVSQVAADILKILQKKLQNVQKIPLSYEDNTLIYHLSTCCALICARVASMRLLTEHEMNIVMRVVGDSITSESNSHSLFAQKPERLAKQMTAKFLLSKLVPLPVIYALLDIVFINMAKYSNPQK